MSLLHEEIKNRYLNYAMSVITSRAIPDVRDGLKPVQRRILYGMYQNLRLTSGAKYRKSAAIVGAVMGKYHPHGDRAIYDAMVRMAQDFSLRYPLVDGHGNFGSIDGDNPAAMRYTEARLLPLAERVLEEIGKDTVGFRANYDGTLDEPEVLPSQIPTLLVNGATGIAVGMATNIPPHNLKEVSDALIDLIDNPTRLVSTLVKHHIKGPDFPTGGIVLESQEEITEAYETGSGTFTVRSRWELEDLGHGKKQIIVTEIPYAVDKSRLIEKIAGHVSDNSVPQITDVRDESTEDIRIVLELKRGADHEAALAYLFKKTPLEDRFHLNLTCLLPTDGDIPKPEQVDLKTALQAFLDFRFDVVTRRTQHDLDKLVRRLHVLEGFKVVFSHIDLAVQTIQAASGKQDAIAKIREKFELSDEQAEAVVSLRLYRLAGAEKDSVLQEFEKKRRDAERLRGLLASEDDLWHLIRNEIKEVGLAYGDERKTQIEVEAPDFDYSAEDYIASEDVFVIASRDGWVRTQNSYGSLDSLRCRDNDEIGWALAANTKETAIFLTSAAKAYTCRIADLPLTTGYGDPVQSYFKFGDGEKLVNVLVVNKNLPHEPAKCEIVAVSRQGQAVRFNLDGYTEPSTVVGRTFMRLEDGDSVVNAALLRGEDDYVVLATYHGRGLTFQYEDVSFYKGAAKGVRAILLGKDDEVLAFELCGPDQVSNLVVETNRGAMRTITHNTYDAKRRGRKGYHIIKRGHLVRFKREPVEVP